MKEKGTTGKGARASIKDPTKKNHHTYSFVKSKPSKTVFGIQ
jgi:hypothetical protein